MPQTKAELLEEVKKLGLKVDPATKMTELRKLINEHETKKSKSLVSESKTSEVSEEKVAKAGKRSAKSLRESEEESSKKEAESKTTKKVIGQKQPRSKLARRSKNYRALASKIEPNKIYALSEAIELIKTTSPVKFDAAVELHVNLSVDPRQAEQNVRDNVILPAGSGKKIKIAALTDEPEVAKKAGADIAGSDDLISLIDKGNLDFDILIATPALMPKLGKYARVLGPKGLMPNPKSGTVTNDIKKAVSEAKAGKVEYRVDSTGIIHLSVGKVSFESSGLKENIITVISSIRSNKPSNVKSNYLKSVFLSSSMGPSINVDPNSLSNEA